MTNRCSLSSGFALLAAMVAGLAVTPVEAAPILTVTPVAGHPDVTVQVSGRGFAANEAVDIYFAKTDELLVNTNASGNFGNHALTIPADATPGKHWISAVGRRTGDSARILFTVRTGWTQRGFSPDGQRDNPYENVLDVTNVGGLDVAWTATVGPHGGSPAIGGGVSATVYATSKNKVNAFNASTGARLWSDCGGPGIRDLTPAIANGMVYIGSNKFFACNSTTGAVRWTVATSSSVTTSAAVAGGVVYFGCGDGKVYALNAVTGAVLWTQTIGGAVYSSPAVANGVMFIGSQDRMVHAFDAATGAVRWAASVGSPVFSAPAVANGMVYVATINGKVHALDAATGAARWTATAPVAIYGAPAVANGTLYVGTNFQKLYAFDAATGAVLWATSIGSAIESTPAVANGVVYVGTNKVVALNAATGAVLWTAANGGSSPAVVNGMLYVTSDLSNSAVVYAYALKIGSSMRDEHAPAPPAAPSLRPNYHLQIAR